MIWRSVLVVTVLWCACPSAAAAAPIPFDATGFDRNHHLRFDFPMPLDLPDGTRIDFHIEFGGFDAGDALGIRTFSENGPIQIGLELRRINGGVDVPGDFVSGPLNAVDLFIEDAGSIATINFTDVFSIEFFMTKGSADLLGLTVVGDGGGRVPLFETTVDPSATAVPEPATLALLGLGLAGVAARRTRRRA